MTEQDKQRISDALRHQLDEAGLSRALEMFPDDVRAAVATAVQVRDSFQKLFGKVAS